MKKTNIRKKINLKPINPRSFWKTDIARRGVDHTKFLDTIKAIRRISGMDFTKFHSVAGAYIYIEENILEKQGYLKKRILNLFKSHRKIRLTQVGIDCYEVHHGNTEKARLIFKISVDQSGQENLSVTTRKLSEYGLFPIEDLGDDIKKEFKKLIKTFEDEVAEQALLL